MSKADEIQLLGDYLPSRITNTSSTLIDNIFSNKNQELYDSRLIYCCMSINKLAVLSMCMSDHSPDFDISSLGKIEQNKTPTTRKVF